MISNVRKLREIGVVKEVKQTHKIREAKENSKLTECLLMVMTSSGGGLISCIRCMSTSTASVGSLSLLLPASPPANPGLSTEGELSTALRGGMGIADNFLAPFAVFGVRCEPLSTVKSMCLPMARDTTVLGVDAY